MHGFKSTTSQSQHFIQEKHKIPLQMQIMRLNLYVTIPTTDALQGGRKQRYLTEFLQIISSSFLPLPRIWRVNDWQTYVGNFQRIRQETRSTCLTLHKMANASQDEYQALLNLSLTFTVFWLCRTFYLQSTKVLMTNRRNCRGSLRTN